MNSSSFDDSVVRFGIEEAAEAGVDDVDSWLVCFVTVHNRRPEQVAGKDCCGM